MPPPCPRIESFVRSARMCDGPPVEAARTCRVFACLATALTFVFCACSSPGRLQAPKHSPNSGKIVQFYELAPVSPPRAGLRRDGGP